MLRGGRVSDAPKCIPISPEDETWGDTEGLTLETFGVYLLCCCAGRGSWAWLPELCARALCSNLIFLAEPEPVTWQMACVHGFGLCRGRSLLGRLVCGIDAGQALASSCPEGAGRAPGIHLRGDADHCSPPACSQMETLQPSVRYRPWCLTLER